MYGNFDGIKRRAKYRKETTSARKERVDKHAQSIARSDKKNVFPKVSEEKANAAKRSVSEKLEKENKQMLIKQVILFVVALLITAYIIGRYIYPIL